MPARNTMRRLHTVAVLLTAWLFGADGALGQAPKLYGGGRRLWRANLDGTAVEFLNEVTSTRALAIDRRAGVLLWATFQDGVTFRAADLDDLEVETASITNFACPQQPDLPEQICPAQALAVDSRAGKVYLAGNFEGGALFRVNLDGSGVEALSMGPPYGIVVDPRRGYVYMVALRVWAANVIDPNFTWVPFVEPTVRMTPFRVAVDLVHDKLYWTEAGRSRSVTPSCRFRAALRRVDLGIGDVETLISFCADGWPAAIGVAVEPGLDAVFWAAEDGIYRADLDGANAQRIIPRDVVGRTFDLAIWSLPGDFDRDGDVDLADLLTFQACMAGAGEDELDPPLCIEADFDYDYDVDLGDLLEFQTRFTGPR